MRESRLRLLQNMPIFGAVREQTLNFILESASIVEVNKGNYFFQEGEPANSMYVLEKGHVAIFLVWEGVQYKLRELNAGDCFGEMALMDTMPRSATVYALQDCQAIEITTQQFYEVYNKYPDQFILMYMNMGRELCRRLRDADSRLFLKELETRQIKS
jgi:CRP/FNR family cyclic AMP-dependent transcriptional regulator